MHIGCERTASARNWRLPANLVGLRRTFTLASGYSPGGSFLVQVIYLSILTSYLFVMIAYLRSNIHFTNDFVSWFCDFVCIFQFRY